MPSDPAAGTPPAGGGNPFGWDIARTMTNAVRGLLDQVTATAARPVFDLLTATILTTPDLPHQKQVRKLWTACAVAADTCFVLLIVIAGVQLAARESMQSRYGFKQLVPRLGVAMVAANCTLPVVATAIRLTNKLSDAIAEVGTSTVTRQAMTQIMNLALQGRSFLNSFLGVAILILGVALLLSYIVRLALLVLLIGGAPLALACWGLPQTAGVAALWCRGVAGLLGIQLAQTLTLVAFCRVFLTPRRHTLWGFPSDKDGLITLLVAVALLWIMCKIPGWVRRLVFRQPVIPLPERPHLPRTLTRLAKTIVLTKTLGALGVFGHVRHTRTATTTATTAVHRPPRSTPARGRGARSGRPAARRASAAAKGTAQRARARASAPPVRGRPAPAAFSAAPVAHTPTPAPAGSARPPRFSAATAAGSAPGMAIPPAASGAPPRFSHATSAAPGTGPATTTPPAAPVFSSAPPAAPRPPTPYAAPVRSGPDRWPARGGLQTAAAPPVFSDAPRAQTTPVRRYPPTPPVFSDPPTTRQRDTDPPDAGQPGIDQQGQEGDL